MMRLPMRPGFWSIGHIARNIPAGYLETLAFDEPRLDCGVTTPT
ncbi:MAG: hypothetical protein ABIP94_14515 [Planctomycetota bacterium]